MTNRVSVDSRPILSNFKGVIMYCHNDSINLQERQVVRIFQLVLYIPTCVENFRFEICGNQCMNGSEESGLCLTAFDTNEQSAMEMEPSPNS